MGKWSNVFMPFVCLKIYSTDCWPGRMYSFLDKLSTLKQMFSIRTHSHKIAPAILQTLEVNYVWVLCIKFILNFFLDYLVNIFSI